MTLGTDEIAALCRRVDGGLMMGHLEQFARWTKHSGSAEEAESLAYVRKALDAYGYMTAIIHHSAYISLPGPARVEVGGMPFAAITHSMSLSSPQGGLKGRLIDVGKATEATLAGQDFKDAILLVDGMATPDAAQMTAQTGAAGTLHVSPHDHLHEMCISPVWGNPDTETADLLPKTVAVTVSFSDGERIRDQLARDVRRDAVLHAEVDTGWRPTPILVADLKAPHAASDAPFVMFSGHHDTWYQGVMDNGAANATMMEAARLLAERRDAWKRGLRLCFWSGHSHGRYSGSTWYADTHWHELESRCAVHVNVDSTGGVGADVVSVAPAATELLDLAGEAVEMQTGQAYAGARLGRNADQSFWGVGIPSLFSLFSRQRADDGAKLRNDLGWWWHTPDDLIDKVDRSNLERDTRVYVHAIARLLCDDVLPLDIKAQVADLRESVEKVDLPAGSTVALDPLLEEIAALEAACGSLADKSDRSLTRLSRCLVPFEYTSGDRFAHDPALPQPAWPPLEPLRRLAAEEPGTHAYHLAETTALRSVNRLRHAVGCALALAASSGKDAGA